MDERAFYNKNVQYKSPGALLNDFLSGTAQPSNTTIKTWDQYGNNFDLETEPASVVKKSDVVSDPFSDSESYRDAAQALEQFFTEEANIANKQFFDYTFQKSENAAQNAYNRSLDYIREYYPALMDSIRAAGLEPNILLSGGASVSSPSYMASGSALGQHKSETLYDNLIYKLLETNLNNSNKTLNTSISTIGNIAKDVLSLVGSFAKS